MAPEPLIPIAGRVDASVPERLDRIAKKLSQRVAGMTVKRADAFRVALERGVVALEAELGLGAIAAANPTKTPAKSAAKKGTKSPARKPAK